MDSPHPDGLSLGTGDVPVRTEWEAAAAAVLRKAGRLSESDPDSNVWTELATRTLDDIEISPLGTPDLDKALTTAGRPVRVGAWDIRPVFADPDTAATSAAILTDLENGGTSVWLELGEYGVPVAGLGTVLDNVLLDAAPVVLDAPDDPIGAARAFAKLARGKQLAAGTNLGVDPVGAALRLGATTSADDAATTIATTAELAGELGCLGLVVDATAVHDLGASDGQELGYLLAVGATYLRVLAAAGHDVTTAAALIEFRLAATDEQFATIAKLRAVRRLWDRLLELSGAPVGSVPMRLHAVTSRPMMSKYDPWVNMLRTTIAAFSAGVAGADAITVLPFDTRLGLPDAFSRRIARNTSSVLVSESHVAQVADPAGGSHVLERLTDDLAVAGWAELGRIEESADVAAGLPGLRARIATVVAERDQQIALRKRPVTGVSEFPNLGETLPVRAPYAGGGRRVRPYGHAFEALRDEPVHAPVYLATMGKISAHTARATFATNLFASGGIAVVNEGRHDDTEAVLSHYSGEQVVCLVGTDPAYAEWGTSLANALREKGARHLIVAGRPLEGCDDSCAMGVDALDFLTRTRERLA